MRLLGIVLLLAGFSVAGLMGWGDGWVSPAQVAAALPPRPTLTPSVQSLPESLARIVLYAGPGYEGAWTLVQWQGGDGVWHDVTGWQGRVTNGQVRWRVAEKDFNTGPFRWVVYDKMGGKAQAVSASFRLPASDNQTLTIEVSPVSGE